MGLSMFLDHSMTNLYRFMCFANFMEMCLRSQDHIGEIWAKLSINRHTPRFGVCYLNGKYHVISIPT